MAITKFREVPNPNIDQTLLATIKPGDVKWMFNAELNELYGKADFKAQLRRVEKAILLMISDKSDIMAANGSVFIPREIKPAPAGVTTLAVDNKYLYICPKFISRISIPYLAVLICHEAYHVVNMHSLRAEYDIYRNRDKPGYGQVYVQLSNLVKDLWCNNVGSTKGMDQSLASATQILHIHQTYCYGMLNDLLMNGEKIYPRAKRILDRAYNKLSAYDPLDIVHLMVRAILDEHKEDQGEGQGEGSTPDLNDNGNPDTDGTLDSNEHILINPSKYDGKTNEQAKKEMQEEIERQQAEIEAVTPAQQRNMEAGRGSAGRSVDAIPADSDLLVAITGGNKGADYAFPKYDCSAACNDITLPTLSGRKKDVALLVDVSGSVVCDYHIVGYLFTQMQLIAQHNNINSVVIICYEGSVGFHAEFDGRELDFDEIKSVCRGGGGTNFDEAIRWCNANLLDFYPDVSEVFHLTDGCARLNEYERTLPMTWLWTDEDTSQMDAASQDNHVQIELN